MKPLYQGKVDTFCAFYAVLNGLRITHGIRTLKARLFFNDFLEQVAMRPGVLRQVLDQTTDYIDLVDDMLAMCSAQLPLTCSAPFSNDDVSVDTLWTTCYEWMNTWTNSTVLLRFFRYFVLGSPPGVRHWTTLESITEKTAHLYDSSHEADAILNLNRDSIVTRVEDVRAITMLYVQPSAVRLLSIPGALKKKDILR